MQVEFAGSADYTPLMTLAQEVEDLFGPMVSEVTFQTALREAISQKRVFCVRASSESKAPALQGGIILSKEANAIVWLVVAARVRKQGLGTRLLKVAINQLDPSRDIVVQTFDASVQAGQAARKLYINAGFVDHTSGGKNPAGVPTVIMRLE